MKIVVLNVYQQCVEVYPIDPHTQEVYGGDNFNPELFLSEQGLPMNDISWMSLDDKDGDKIPVFWNGEEKPLLIL